MDYAWPGNVRELQNAICFSLVKCRDRLIRPEHLPQEIRENGCGPSKSGPEQKLTPDVVRAALREAGGNRSRAARLLGVGRATLYRFFERYPDVS